MIRSAPLAVIAAAAASAAFAQGPVATFDRGSYTCELPGNASTPVGLVQADKAFTIETASRYSSPQGGGTYLRRANRLEMTSGPRKGEAYQIVHAGFVRQLQADGTPGRLRCVLQGSVAAK